MDRDEVQKIVEIKLNKARRFLEQTQQLAIKLGYPPGLTEGIEEIHNQVIAMIEKVQQNEK
jgi:hypothetical protein